MQLTKKQQSILITILCAIPGIFARVFQFAQVPDGFQMDECYSGLLAYSLFHSGLDTAGQSFPVYFEAWGHGMNALNSYLMLPFLALNGGKMTLAILRMPQLLVALLSLYAFYLLGKKIEGPLLGNLCLLVLGTCPWHICMSRWGLESCLLPGFLLFGFVSFLYALDRPKLFWLTGLFWGLSLYCYAVVWPILPIIILLLAGYSLFKKQTKISLHLLGGVLVLGALALPLVAFLLVNTGHLNSFHIGPFSVYRMSAFRGSEIATSFSQIMANLKNTIVLFVKQDIGRPYDVIMPYGFFLPVRIFIVAGVLLVLKKAFSDLKSKTFSLSLCMLIWLFCSAITGLMIQVGMTQINAIYLPLLYCEAYCYYCIIRLIRKLTNGKQSVLFQQKKLLQAIPIIMGIAYAACFLSFEYHYFTDYKKLTQAYFQKGTDSAVQAAFQIAKEQGKEIEIEDGLKYPNVLLALEMDANEYLSHVVYTDYKPAPKSFQKQGVTITMGIDFDQLSKDKVYVFYEKDLSLFEDYTITSYGPYWFIAR